MLSVSSTWDFPPCKFQGPRLSVCNGYTAASCLVFPAFPSSNPASAPYPYPCLEGSHLLLQGETQVVAGRLDLVLGLQMGHGICVDAVDGHHEVTLAELGLGCLASWSDLVGWQKWRGKVSVNGVVSGKSSGCIKSSGVLVTLDS